MKLQDVYTSWKSDLLKGASCFTDASCTVQGQTENPSEPSSTQADLEEQKAEPPVASMGSLFEDIANFADKDLADVDPVAKVCVCVCVLHTCSRLFKANSKFF